MRFLNPLSRATRVLVALLITITLALVAYKASLTPSFTTFTIAKYLPESVKASSPTVGDNKNVSYDLSTAPRAGCENIVNDLQRKLIAAYSERLKGIRYANIWGYQETENKGDGALFSAQYILLSMLGIETMEVCRFAHKGCDMERFRSRLEEHQPHSAILMTGGGNFNDLYWEDQPSRIDLIQKFPNASIRSFPQSIHMTDPKKIQKTKDAYVQHRDLQLAARDRPSYEWLVETFGTDSGITNDLIPDIAFMWGNRPDFRINGEKTNSHDVLILARKDGEGSNVIAPDLPYGEGLLDLGGTAGNVTYRKVDWKAIPTPDINGPDKRSTATRKLHQSSEELEVQPRTTNPNSEAPFTLESGKQQRAWAKAMVGFELLGTARFVITDRLHGHILATIIGVPHVLMDSKLGKGFHFHNTWTRDCECTRVASTTPEAFGVARLFFEDEKNRY